jgi:hypothetical protein
MYFVSTPTGILPTKTMMKISRYIPLIFLFCFQETAAQPLAKLKEEGLNFYERGKFGEAFELLSRFEEQKSGDVLVETALGITAFQLNKLGFAKQYLQAALTASGKKVEPTILLGLGISKKPSKRIKNSFPIRTIKIPNAAVLLAIFNAVHRV